MANSTPPPSHSSPSLSSNTVSWRSRWAQRLSWLISALSGTLEIEAAHRQKMQDYEQRQKDYEQRMREDEQEIAKLDAMILQTRNEKKRIKNDIRQIEKETEQIEKETEQIRRDNERLAVLKSKIDSSFSKHGINLPLAQIPKQP
jgi:septal ring factor EnvC (AmiA/AmiB activator)